MSTEDPLHSYYYLDLMHAYLRGLRPDLPSRLGRGEELVAWARSQDIRVHRFKRNAELPRVRRVLSLLQGLRPASLIDVGTGRGTFLWPLLDELRQVPVTCVERNPARAEQLAAVARGGIERLYVVQADAARIPLEDGAGDVVTALEVMEHVTDPDALARELIRCARRFVVLTVPSKEDDNPEHIHLFDGAALRRILLGAGANRVQIQYLHNHILALGRVS